ncbi:hypothetical protein [Sagittula salina]|uniref:Uncharacterized protein n=1 Tax=Sagittula salina TaxID=2820268 RepID=A0A940S1E2_9RHOB|nr:hypothetical protein [Sagittula salina]MBP0484053.1 hypothetical protein [Sagittula salina]
MTTFEIILSITSVVVAICVSAWMRHLGNTSGRDRQVDPERLRHFIENPPTRGATKS